MKITEWIRSRRELNRKTVRCGFLAYVLIHLVFTRFQTEADRWKDLTRRLDDALFEKIITQSEYYALKSYAMLKIFHRVDAELVLKADQTIVYNLMNEVGFTYV